ncbi:MAG: Na(+)/H(+) antiporter subunit B [Pseudomonadota bacterium]|nr:Na(+)/H(+) antiporter subunit B [Pseudomonadota bacterium]
MIHHLIPRVLAKLLIPFILLFGLYVQFHGDFGPGGGFQAGVIFAAGIILYALIYGLQAAQSVIPARLVAALMALGLLIYAGVGVATMMLGGNFLDYDLLDSHDPVHGQHLGILVIEFGVGVTVAAVMITIFYQFAGRLHLVRDLEAESDGS